MKHNKQVKRKRSVNMCSDKVDVLNANSGNKKKKINASCSKNDSSRLCGDVNSNFKYPVYSNENLENKIIEDKPIEKIKERNERQCQNGINQGNFCGGNKMFPKCSSRNNDNHGKVTHKNKTGSNNWKKFLIDQGKQIVTSKNPEQTVNEIKPITFNPPKIKVTKVIGMDCEMVGAGEDGRDNLLARVSIVNLYGDCLYDKFVKPKETVTDYRTHVSGVRAADLKNAEDFETVQEEVAALIKGKILVGHAIKNDLEVLYLSHPRQQIRDTSKFFRKKGAGTPSLKNLAAEYLNLEIQSGEHSSVQDAQASVHLYNMFRKQWESSRIKRHNRIDNSSHL